MYNRIIRFSRFINFVTTVHTTIHDRSHEIEESKQSEQRPASKANNANASAEMKQAFVKHGRLPGASREDPGGFQKACGKQCTEYIF